MKSNDPYAKMPIIGMTERPGNVIKQLKDEEENLYTM